MKIKKIGIRGYVWGFCAAGLSFAVFALLSLVVHLYLVSKGLPDYMQLRDYDLPTVTRFYASDQTLIGEYFHENRLYVPISAIPRRLINAFLAAEDRHFYEDNLGLDFFAIARAAIRNIVNLDTGKLEGGSTITQQVVKNLLLTSERTFQRKIREVILAYRITKALSKDRIMELYLNKIYLGNGSYGVASAALKYFNKSINELTLAEEALLAALPRAPSRLAPTKNNLKVLERRNWVIHRMLDSGFITPEEAVEVKFHPIILDSSYSDRIFRADFFSEEVRKEVISKYGTDSLYKGGLFVKTSLVPRYQEIAQNALSKALINYDTGFGWRGNLQNIPIEENWRKTLLSIEDPPGTKNWKLGVVLKFINEKTAQVGLKSGETIDVVNLEWAKNVKIGDVLLVEVNSGGSLIRQVPKINGAVIVMDVNSGKVLAMVGGYDYEISKFNCAIQAMRQPGSLIKPFVFLAALEAGMNNTSIIMDEKLEIFQGPYLPLWVPKNYEKKFFGPTTLRRGFESSRNIVGLQIAKMVGLKSIHSVLKNFKLYESTKFNNMSAILGSLELNLLDIVRAYAMIANGGSMVEPSVLELIQDRNGKIVYKRDSRRKCIDCDLISYGKPEISEVHTRIVDQSVAYQIISLMEGAVLRGTSRGLKGLKMVLGGKTGTSNESKDAWYVGFTPDTVVGVYLGFDIPKPIGANYTGARVALPVFRDIIKEIGKERPERPFNVPNNVSFAKVDYRTGVHASGHLDSEHLITEVLPEGVYPREDVISWEAMDRLATDGKEHDIAVYD